MNTENQNTEFKVSWRDEYLKWICGFANAQGGKLYIGVDDNGDVRGVQDAHRLAEELPNKIVALLGIVPDVNVLEKDGREYIEIAVAPSNVPISLKGVYHYRSGSTKQELNGIALQQFILKKLGRTWDDIICEQARPEHIDRTAIDYFLRKAVAAQRLPEESLGQSTETVLKNLGLVDAEGKLKNAAVLLFARNPQLFIPAVHFKIGFFGRDDADLIFQDLVEGNILKMCDTVVETLKAKYLISPIHYEGLQRIEPLEIPEDALREAIFNSIIHKDYMGQPIQMKVWRDRIELWNSGKLPDDLPPEKLLEEHSSEARNKNIAFVFYKAGFIEAWGRGISKIVTRFKQAGLKEPKFEDFCGGFRITLYRNPRLVDETIAKNAPRIGERTGEKKQVDKLPQNDPTNDPNTGEKVPESGTMNGTMDGTMALRIVRVIEKEPSATLDQLSQRLSVARRTLVRYMNVLQENKRIKRVGGKRFGHWEVVE